MLEKISAILGSVRWWAVVLLFAIAVYKGSMDVLVAVEYILGSTVAIGTIDRLAEKMGRK